MLNCEKLIVFGDGKNDIDMFQMADKSYAVANRMLFGEKMPDKNDPKYKDRYEREVSAGRKFAQATRIDKAAAKVQGFANAHRILFLVIVFGFAIGGFTWNIYRITMAYRNSRPTRTATEMQDSVLRERHKRLQGGEIRENRNENKKYEPQ